MHALIRLYRLWQRSGYTETLKLVWNAHELSKNGHKMPSIAEIGSAFQTNGSPDSYYYPPTGTRLRRDSATAFTEPDRLSELDYSAPLGTAYSVFWNAVDSSDATQQLKTEEDSHQHRGGEPLKQEVHVMNQRQLFSVRIALSRLITSFQRLGSHCKGDDGLKRVGTNIFLGDRSTSKLKSAVFRDHSHFSGISGKEAKDS
jgi:hypothetical protein